MDHVRFRQSFQGIPVFAGEVIIHLKESGVTEAFSTLIPDFQGVDTDPAVTLEDALENARNVIVIETDRSSGHLPNAVPISP